MTKRIISAAAALMMLFTCAFSLAEGTGSTIPEGLEAMYALVENPSNNGLSFFTLLPYGTGKAVLSVALTYTNQNHSVSDILSSAPTIRQKISALCDSMGEITVSSGTKYGVPVAEITTSFLLGGLPVNAECICFSVQYFMVELWILSPDASFYADDPTLAEELEADLALARKSRDNDGTLFGYANNTISILTGEATFSENTAHMDAALPESELYVDPDGFFSLQVVKGTVALTPSSTAEEISAVKESFLAAYPDDPSCAERWFALIEDDILLEGGTVLFTPDFQGNVTIFREEHPEYIGQVTLKSLAGNCEAIRTNLTDEYGDARLTASFEKETVSNLEHVRETYALSCESTAITLGLLDALSEEGIFWEIGVFAVQEDLYHSLYRLTVESIEYLR